MRPARLRSPRSENGIGHAHPCGKIRVLHISSGDVWGGAEVQLWTLLRELTGLGDVVARVLMFNHGYAEERFREIGIEVAILDEHTRRTPSLVYGIADAIQSWRPNVIHTHGYKECVLGTVANKLTANIPCVRTIHGSPESFPRLWELRKVLARWAENVALRRQQAIVGVSGEMSERLSRQFRAQRIAAIDNGIDVEEIVLRGAETGTVRRQSGVVQIGVVGRLAPVKRIDIFLRVCQILHRKLGDQFRGWVIGDGPLRAQLHREVESLGLAGRVEMPGFVANVPASLMALDALLITSDHEGLPMLLLEAMALGIPVVARAVGGIPDVLDRGSCGTLVEGQDPHHYADAVAGILEKPAEAVEKARRARTRAGERFSVRNSAHRYRDLYRELSDAQGDAA